MSDSAIIILRAPPETLENFIHAWKGSPLETASDDIKLIRKGLVSFSVKDFASGKIPSTLETILERFEGIRYTIVHDIESNTGDCLNYPPQP